MKKLGLLLVAVATLIGTGAQASSWCDMDGCFEVGGEALWLKPTGAEFQYAYRADSTTNRLTVTTDTVVADYDWGFKVFGIYHMGDCCASLFLDWTRLRTSDANSLHDVDVFPAWLPEAPTGLARVKANLRFDYDKVNLRYERTVACNCDTSLFAYVGGRYLNLEERRGYTLTATDPVSLSARELSRFQGGGMQIGFTAEHDMCWGVSIVADGALSAAIGELKSTLKLQEGAAITRFPIHNHTVCVPGTEFKLGLAYTYKCDCWWIRGEFGYRLDYYWNALLLRGATGDSLDDFEALLLEADRTNVGFGGLYFGLSARF